MAVARFGKGAKRPPFRFCAKVSLVVFLGLCFIVVWSTFSSPSSSVTSQRSSFGEIAELEKEKGSGFHPKPTITTKTPTSATTSRRDRNGSPVQEKKGGKGEIMPVDGKNKDGGKEMAKVAAEPAKNTTSKPVEPEREGGEVEPEREGGEEVTGEEGGLDGDLEGGVDVDSDEAASAEEDTEGKSKNNKKKKKKLPPLFDSRAHYSWKSCGMRTGQNYIPCIDLEGAGSGRFQGHRHHERSCPRTAPMCLVPLPQGYRSPVPWPESQLKVFYANVAHPKLSSYIKTHNWLKFSDYFLTFPQNESIFGGPSVQYLDFIDEMVPDIEWGKNIRVVLDIGSTDASFGAALLEKEVLTLSLGLMDDQTDLAQLYLERGFPAVIGKLGTRRLPFPSGIFDAIHCGECSIPWHSNGGKLLLEMNRILRPGGYFIFSFKHRDVEGEEGMSALTASICWNILAHKTDEETGTGVKIYQRPSSNDIYELRRKNNPPLCKEDEKQDDAWYTPIKTCLHTIPAAIEQRGTDWPEEWPKRLETFPEWLADSQERLIADTEHWKAIVNRSYLNGMDIDWSKVRNILDMKAIYGGLAAALASQKVWVMNVVPVHAPNTLPIIYERGLLGVYHDWCESFSTYPRSYDLLHADHLFSRLKNRCKQPDGIVIEMDRILRPGGWAIIRDKLEILNPLETILRTLHWEIRMTYAKDKEGIICVQKITWRP